MSLGAVAFCASLVYEVVKQWVIRRWRHSHNIVTI